jgi:hypothetical protein
MTGSIAGARSSAACRSTRRSGSSGHLASLGGVVALRTATEAEMDADGVRVGSSTRPSKTV